MFHQKSSCVSKSLMFTLIINRVCVSVFYSNSSQLIIRMKNALLKERFYEVVLGLAGTRET